MRQWVSAMSLECLCDVFGKDKTAVRKAVGDFPDIEVEAMIVSRKESASLAADLRGAPYPCWDCQGVRWRRPRPAEPNWPDVVNHMLVAL